jgi:hypothetical protein
MPSSRQGLPDNLDPLVDTLSNVVGILVVVVALNQIQVGDAIDRLVAVDSARLPAARNRLTTLEATHAEASARLDQAQARRARILERGGHDVETSLAAADALLELAKALPKGAAPRPDRDAAALREGLARRRAELEEASAALANREAFEVALKEVPRELVARLPDPTVLTGEEQWILCRFGRVFLTDRTRLVSAGEKAIGRILDHMDARAVRADEYESLALYLRKREVGEGNFVWRFVTQPMPRARLEWRSRDVGVEPSRLESSAELRGWIAGRDPSRQFIKFQVWSDSFEAYLEARRVVEAAGFRAGWRAFDADEDMEIPVTFGVRPSRERPIEVD